jgi:hypothetical protein
VNYDVPMQVGLIGLEALGLLNNPSEDDSDEEEEELLTLSPLSFSSPIID